jgi:hypothetical protein
MSFAGQWAHPVLAVRRPAVLQHDAAGIAGQALVFRPPHDENPVVAHGRCA